MKNFIKIVFILSFAVVKMNAQVVVKTDTISGTPLTVSMDKRINSLLEDAEGNCVRTNGSKTFTGVTNDDESRVTTPTRINVPERSLSNAEICRRNPRIMGYKIQLVVVKSNEEANEVKSYFRRRFPAIKAETDASLRPSYKVLVGSYFSKQSASSDLSKVREFFKSAIAVQYRVFCAEAK